MYLLLTRDNIGIFTEGIYNNILLEEYINSISANILSNIPHQQLVLVFFLNVKDIDRVGKF